VTVNKSFGRQQTLLVLGVQAPMVKMWVPNKPIKIFIRFAIFVIINLGVCAVIPLPTLVL